ncbi:cytochrome c biogenesis CcdA family protein [Actinomyces vulturis]|uniref:cytochrome c biogenesis CcdA family protein n=1 Tax=Actinomyces vulturis TaxID=1857645 RepID=UPI0008361F6E|nr:cytochrome c biogenesis CcdA family protein [Actinomyces vulturis]
MTGLAPLAAFVGGLLTLLAPCSVMVLPAFFAYAFASPTTLLKRTLIFWLGLLTTLVPLGAAAGGVGSLLHEYSAPITVVAAVIIITLGIIEALSIEIPTPHLPGSSRSSDDAASPLSVYLLGLVYGLAGVGCAGPILGSVLLMAGINGSAIQAAGLMVLYATGMALPLGILALLWTSMGMSGKKWLRPRPVRFLSRETTWTNLISGLLFVILGVVLLLMDPSNPLGGIISSERLAALELQVMDAAARIPWYLSLAILGTITAAIVIAVKDRRQ